MSIANKTQYAYWAGDIGKRWAREADHFDHLLAPVTQALMSAAKLRAGQNVLDIGCGAGASSLAAAHIVGPTGRVLGVDISPALLKRAEDRTRDLGIDQLSFERADAQITDFGDRFDAVISRIGAMFFTDPIAAFMNISKALKPEAQMTLACWSDRSENPWFGYPALIREDFFGPSGPPPQFTPGPLAFSDADAVTGMLQGAGFANVAADYVDVALPTADSLDGAVAFMASISPLQSLLAELAGTSGATQRIIDRTAELLAPHLGPHGVSLPGRLIMYSAQA
jgi:SAM-dependent methyltransferase